MSTKDELQKAGVYVLPPVAPEAPESTLIMERLHALGYRFRLNLCTDTVEVNERPLSDITAAKIRMQLRDIGLTKKIKAAEDAYIAEAETNAYHPVRDYLNSLVWDKEDHIWRLADCLISDDAPIVYRDGSAHPLLAVYLYRWLIGAVAKVLSEKQNLMLVFDGPQGIGKSTFVAWLCSGLPHYFIEGPINVADKDSDVRLISRFIWEVSELGATTRKADVEALKEFITKRIVSVRKAYGRYDIVKPALASFIGTVNNTTGFLTDDSGNRRFMITHLSRIDRSYLQIDVNQVWAQAVALYREGEQHMLVGEETQAQTTANKNYHVETVLDDWLEKYFLFDPAADDLISLADIVEALARDDIRLSGSERIQALELAGSLIRHGAKRVHTRLGKRWVGLCKIPR
jgi:putative DNA primase/helicase